MLITTFNIRGLGGALKRNKVKELIRQHNIEFMALQETKMEVINNSFCKNLRGGVECS